MWWKQGSFTRSKYQTNLRGKILLDPKFQIRHSLFLVLSMNIPVLILLGCSYYFLKENYGIFLEMAYRYSPELVPHLERESNMLSYLFIVGALGLVSYTFLVGIRTTYRLIGPVYAMKRHLKNMIRGDWAQPPLKIRESDDYHELIDIYNYFYSSLRRQGEWELEQISKCKIAPYALESQERHKALILYKAAQLSLDEDIYFDSNQPNDMDDSSSKIS
ncbi:MAG: hypothetical protein VX642_12390 [Bdellovibrionota bacterium]|nr:hypothetical protein [Bdellovibrionota bacterium]